MARARGKVHRLVIVTASAVVFASLTSFTTQSLATTAAAAQAAPRGRFTVAAAGDIAGDPLAPAAATARLVERLNVTKVLTLGDNVYGKADLADFKATYHPTWGRFKRRTAPVPGNHDYATPGAAGYFAYFGVPSWYRFRIGTWAFYALNSETNDIRQYASLTQQLRKDRCAVAYWHTPVDAATATNPKTPPARLRRIVTGRVALVLNGSEHFYRRDVPDRGTKFVTVGTGGARLEHLRPRDRGLVALRRFGVLHIEFRPNSYRAWFRALDGGPRDTFNGTCAAAVG